MSINRRPRGFTLVEMLVVLGIIALLVGLLLPAVMAAVNASRRAQMALEISQLDQAVNAYKNQFGDFPPRRGLQRIEPLQHRR
jgi:prepilin-type N-terminal cleavage/methylation domain-containing protein